MQLVGVDPFAAAQLAGEGAVAAAPDRQPTVSMDCALVRRAGRRGHERRDRGASWGCRQQPL